MTKEKTKKNLLDVKDILKKKEFLKDYSSYHSEFFNKDIQIDKIPASKVVEIMNNTEDDEYEKYNKLVYLSCPIFRSKELINELGADNPYDVVGMAYSDNYCEIFELGNLILERYGFISDKVVQLKK